MRPHSVAVTVTESTGYPTAPFHPHQRYPEYRQTEFGGAANSVYRAVRENFRLLGLDARRFGTPDWNPLGQWIRPGMSVLVKPNLVRHFHPYGLDTDSLYTHGSVIRAVCDYALIALAGQGQLVIADAPLQTCDFDEVCRLSGVTQLVAMYQAAGKPVELRDLRLVRARAQSKGWYGKVLVQENNPGDPTGYTKIDLAGDSLHSGRESAGRYRVTCYDPEAMENHHGGGRHEYVVANTLLHADVVLNLPKMKTHHKAGITGALKNFIGINGHKDCLPHHVQGSSEEGGDEYAHTNTLKRLDSWILDEKERRGGALTKKGAAVAHRMLRAIHMREAGNSYWEGSWYGNDTISRTTIDLNRIVRYADRNGCMQRVPQRPVVTIVDGVIAGEKDGPLAPTPRAAGLVITGDNPVAVDLIVARLMGFRWETIPTLKHAMTESQKYGLLHCDSASVKAISSDSQWNGLTPDAEGESLSFEPHSGWKGHIER